MENNVRHGIVLRTYIPAKQKLSILDTDLGKIDGVPANLKNALKLSHGTFISYLIRPWHLHYVVYNINIIDEPYYWAKNNFLFFHHVLELCYYFLSVNNIEIEIFELIKILYTQPEILKTELDQKIFLCHFFKKLGIYPYNYKSYDQLLLALISGRSSKCLDNILDNINDKDEKDLQNNLNKWLLSCVNEHPYVYRFKTLDFLKKLDIHE